VRGVLIAHGEMARGLVDAVGKISGQEGALVALSNEGSTPAGLRELLERVLGTGPAVIFTDLQAGSCALAALASANRAETVVLCGANLPMLLDFVFHRDLPLDTLSERLVEKGRAGIRSLRPKGLGASGAADERGPAGC
jgi:mannose/fructose-specific phosphotransferase system component IIA